MGKIETRGLTEENTAAVEYAKICNKLYPCGSTAIERPKNIDGLTVKPLIELPGDYACRLLAKLDRIDTHG